MRRVEPGGAVQGKGGIVSNMCSLGAVNAQREFRISHEKQGCAGVSTAHSSEKAALRPSEEMKESR